MITVLILIEFAYDIHEELVERADEADQSVDQPGFCSNRYRVIYIIMCMSLVIGSIVGWILMFNQFDCSFAKGMVAQSLIVGLVLMVGAMATSTGWLPGAVVMSYITWLCASALSKYNDD